MGPRVGRFYDENGNPLETPHSFPPHSVALQLQGTFILWVGWYGFNPGSALAIDNSASAAAAGLCAVTTTMAAAAGVATCMFTDTFLEMRATGASTYDLTCAMNGCLAGLVSITAGCSVVPPWAAVLIGMLGGWVYLGASRLLVRLRIDDVVDAIPVHFACGMWGVLAVGLFAEESRMAIAGYKSKHTGWFYSWGKGSGDANLLLANFVSILWIIGWVGALMTPFFFVLKFLGMFRVSPLEEEVGMDISHHRGAAYNMEGPEKSQVAEWREREESLRNSHHSKTSPDNAPKEEEVEDVKEQAVEVDVEVQEES